MKLDQKGFMKNGKRVRDHIELEGVDSLPPRVERILEEETKAALDYSFLHLPDPTNTLVGVVRSSWDPSNEYATNLDDLFCECGRCRNSCVLCRHLIFHAEKVLMCVCTNVPV